MITLADVLAPKSDRLSADALIPGPRTITFTAAKLAIVDKKPSLTLNYEGDDGKPFIPCKTMGRAMIQAWSITDPEQLVGKSVTVYRDPEVTFGDQGAIGGVRISHMSHIDKAISMKLTKTQGRKAVFNFQPLETAKPKVDPAAWANDHIGDIKTTTDADEFATVKAGGVKAMAKLAQSFPDLHKLVLSAYHQQADSFREGKPDADTGEGFTDDDTDPFGLKHFAEDRITDDLIAASQ